MSRDFIEPGERDILALRLIPISPEGLIVRPASNPSAAWLVRRRACLGAVGIAVGNLVSDGVQVGLALQEITALPARADCDQIPADCIYDVEALLLQQLSDLWLRLSSPLLVTCGGRSLDLPFLRYRCLARGVAMPGLHLGAPTRFVYFDRYNLNWHFDLADFLAVHGASQPLSFDELCSLCQVPRAASAGDLNDAVLDEAARLFALLARTFHVIGHC